MADEDGGVGGGDLLLDFLVCVERVDGGREAAEQGRAEERGEVVQVVGGDYGYAIIFLEAEAGGQGVGEAVRVVLALFIKREKIEGKDYSCRETL